MTRRPPSIAIATGAVLAAPTSAHAHLVQTGFGAFYDGITHLVITPGDLLLVVGLALLAGLRGRAVSRDVLLALPVAWLAGGLAGAWLPATGALTLVTSLSFGLVGVLVALDRRLPRPIVVGLACAAGLLHGVGNGTTMVSGTGTLALVGAAAAALVVVTLIPAVVVAIRHGWARIAVRVAGSWIAAVGLLMVGWIVRSS